jgi:hypothetical protein
MKQFNWRLSLIVLVMVMTLSACGGATPAPTALPTAALTATSATVATRLPTATHTPLPPTATFTPLPPPTVAPSATAAPKVPFALTSSAFAEGETIPDQYTYRLTGQCAGENLSPELAWVGTPAGTQSFAVIVIDPDGGDWVHWLQFNIPGDAASLPEAAGGPDVGVKGKNDFGELGYGGPCPPGGTHRYVFTLYALDTMLSAAEGATRSDVEKAMADHILGQVRLTGLRSP